MYLARTARVALGVVAVTLCACSSSTAPGSGSGIDGSYILESASGAGPASGSLILTRAGYAERRVRFRETSGALSKEYLARGTVSVNADNTVELELKEMDLVASEPWKPEVRLIERGLEMKHLDADGFAVVERYRRK